MSSTALQAEQEGTITIDMMNAALRDQESRLRAEFSQQIAALEDRLRAHVAEVCDAVKQPPAKAKKASKFSCFVCGGVHNVHRHRDLSVHLDDKCRKQIETFKTGGTVTERRDDWMRALSNIGENELAQKMRRALDELAKEAEKAANGSFASLAVAQSPKQNFKKRRLETEQPAQCDNCAVCHEAMDASSVEKPLLHTPCAHTFHKHCIIPWLQKEPRCPLCRTGVQLAGHDATCTTCMDEHSAPCSDMLDLLDIQTPAVCTAEAASSKLSHEVVTLDLQAWLDGMEVENV